MPQLNKGGKFIFGISVIHPDLTVHISLQALSEYDATRDGKVIIFTGSKITGGFCVTTYSLLSNSKLKHILEDCPALRVCFQRASLCNIRDANMLGSILIKMV